MRCPKCKYEPTLAEQTNSKDQCPSCGIFYEKYIAQLKSKLNGDPPVDIPAPVKVPQHKVASVVAGDSQPVVVVDIQMRFWSMVVFMVKWAFAAIPAIIIIGVIITVVTMFSAGFIAGIGSGSKSASSSAPVSTYEEPKQSSGNAVKTELITATLTDKGFSEENYTESNTLTIAFENKTGREVRAFEGVAVLSDLLGNQIKRVRLSENNPDWMANTLIWSGSVRFNQFIQDDVRLKNTPFDSLRMSFEIKKILYNDGELQEF